MKRWKKCVIGLMCVIIVIVPACFLFNHLRLNAFRQSQRVGIQSTTRHNPSPSTKLEVTELPSSAVSDLKTTLSCALTLTTTNTLNTSPNTLESHSKKSKNAASGAVAFPGEQSILSTYDVSRRSGWGKLATLTDKYFMVGYIGLLKSVETGVWACGGSLPQSLYIEIGSESLRLGQCETAYFYLKTGLDNGIPFSHRDYYMHLLNIASDKKDGR